MNVNAKSNEITCLSTNCIRTTVLKRCLITPSMPFGYPVRDC